MVHTDASTCPHCGASVPQDFRYCGRCGRPLSRWSPEQPVDAAQSLDETAERRQITVMFCDLVGSVQLSGRLDPEDFASVVLRYQKVCVEAIESHDGYVAQYLGDGILAYFGYPTADERVAEEAVRAGLEILGRMKLLSAEIQQLHGHVLNVRIGVHTGVVVVEAMGSGAHRERLALGETPNLAARLQVAAAPNTLVVSRETHRLIEDGFRVEDLGSHVLKGHGAAQPIFRVVEEVQDTGLLMPEAARDAGDIIGREEDIGQLLCEWKMAKDGLGRAVVITGEGGLGKSRLVQQLRTRIGEGAHYAVVCRCTPNTESTPFHPLIDWFSRVLNFYPEQPTADRIDMIRFVTHQNGLEDDDVVPILGSLLTKSSLTDLSELGYSPARARARTHEVLDALFQSMAQDRPLLFVIEDLQWIDPSTRDFLLHFTVRLDERAALLLMTSREALPFGIPGATPLSHIELSRLRPNQIDAVIAQAANGRALPAVVVEHIRSRADGVPLYAEEFTKMVIESDLLEKDVDGFQLRSDLPELSIPTTLQDALMARLDRFMPVKEVAQASSFLGRCFTVDLVQAALPVQSERLKAALDQLVEAHVLVREGGADVERYAFRHALLQEAAYESMLKSSRVRTHRRLARHLIAQADARSVRAETIAHHLERAGDRDTAASYWYTAGKEAQDRWANEEAAKYYRRSLALIDDPPPSDEHRRTVFHTYVGLSVALLQKKGYTHPEVAGAFERAAELAHDLRDATASIPAFMGLWSHYTVLGDHMRAEVLAERVTKLAQLAPRSLITFSALSMRAITWFWEGDIGASRALIESLFERYDEVDHTIPPGLAIQHPRVSCLSYLSLIHWAQGRPEQADTIGAAAVRTAEQIGHPFSLAFAWGFNSLLNIYMGRVNAARRAADKTIEVAEHYGFPFWVSVARIVRSWSAAEDDAEWAAAGMRRELCALSDAGVRIWTTYPAALMAEMLGRLGRLDEAMEAFDTVIGDCELHGEYYFMPEVRRLRARLLDRRGELEQAAQERESALAMAGRQTAHALSLRILNDMARYDGAPSTQLKELLSATVGSFAEGSETPDLVHARALLTASTRSRPSTTGRA